MVQIDRLLEQLDLRTLYALASIAGALLSLIAMQFSWEESTRRGGDTNVMLNLRRASFVIISLTLLWSLSYAETKGWQPWPPALAIVLAVDFYLLVLICMVARKVTSAFSRSTTVAPWPRPSRVRHDGSLDH